MAPDLKSILTPSLFHHIYDARFPYEKGEALDISKVSKEILEDDFFKNKTRDRAWPAIKALSTFGVDNVPDLMQFLPDPADADFPIQLLGLQLLLDQCPRDLCVGVDARYSSSYFFILQRRLADQWSALPQSLRPDSWERWEGMGATFELWVFVRIYWNTPWVHGETRELQTESVAFTNVTREAVERRTGTRDAYRDDPTIWTDTHAFLRVYRAGPPRGDITLEKLAYWICMLMDIHKPIVDAFGRYPYRNMLAGRENTLEEEQWLKDEPSLPKVDEEVKRRVWADIKAGRWTPLPDNPPPRS